MLLTWVLPNKALAASGRRNDYLPYGKSLVVLSCHICRVNSHQMENIKQIDASTLRQWLESNKSVSILDIRPSEERKEWYIPGSFHIDAYGKLNQNDPNALQGMYLDKAIPVVAVCGAGKTSLIAADILQKQGYETYSLQDGMKGWSLAWNKATLAFQNYDIAQLRRTGKGCLSYIVVSCGEAIIIDASLPTDIYRKILKENEWQLKAVMETHIHADHLSRSKQLADELGVLLLLPVHNQVAFPHKEVDDGQTIDLGIITMKVIATPGHTIESICFLVNKEVLVSGDTIFTNSIGRPDLKANESEARTRTALLYDSIQKIMLLQDSTIVLPGHTSAPVDFDGKPIKSSIGDLKRNLSVIQLPKNEFINTILNKLPAVPSNHLAIVERNLTGNILDVNPIDLEAGANRCAVS